MRFAAEALEEHVVLRADAHEGLDLVHVVPHRVAVDERLAVGDRVQAGHHVDRRRLTSAVLAEKWRTFRAGARILY